MTDIITEFVTQGKFCGVGLGDSVDKLRAYSITPSTILNAKGKPELYLVDADGYIANVGVDIAQRIRYIVLHINDQEHNALRVGIGSNAINLNGVALEELTAWLNENNLEWNFSHYWQKVVKLKVEQSQTEFVFDFFDYEDVVNGLVSVHVSIADLVASKG